MTPREMADIHARAALGTRAWSADEFQGLIASTGVFTVTEGACFALGRVIAGDCELLLIATDPAHQRCGLARLVLERFETQAAHRGADMAFLEVAATNAPALALYQNASWEQSGRRTGYYRFEDGSRHDAILMCKSLGQ